MRNENELICGEIEFLHVNPNHTVVWYRDGKIVSITDLVPSPSIENLGSPHRLSEENPSSNNSPTEKYSGNFISKDLFLVLIFVQKLNDLFIKK